MREFCRLHSAKTGIHMETLRARLKKLVNPPVRAHGNQKFTDDDEIFLAAYLRCMASRQIPLSSGDVVDALVREQIFASRGTAKSWVRRFLEKHRGALRMARTKEIGKERMPNDGIKKVITFISKFEALNLVNLYSARRICNCDETPATKLNSDFLRRIVRAEDKRPARAYIPDSTLTTLLPFIFADGKVMAIFHVYSVKAGKNFLLLNKVDRHNNREHELRGHPPTYAAYSLTGFMTRELWNDIMQVAALHFNAHLKGAKGLLLVDQCAAHVSDVAVETLHKVGVDTLYFPSQLTHIMQPCDSVVFAAYKQHQPIEAQRMLQQVRLMSNLFKFDTERVNREAE